MAVLLVLVMASLLINLSSGAQVGLVRQENMRLRQEMDALRKEYQALLAHIQSAKTPPTPAAVTPTPAAAPVSAPPAVDVLIARLKQLQQLLMVYASHHHGKFPPSLEVLERFLEQQALNPPVLEPPSAEPQPLVSAAYCLDITHQTLEEGHREQAGKLLYQANLDALGEAESFTLAALDPDSLLLRTPVGELLTLGPAERAPELAQPL